MLNVLTDHWPEFRSGFWVTVRLVVISFGIAMVVGTLVAALRIAPNKWLQRVGGVYVEIFRNIPLLVLLFISYAGLRRGGVDINAWVAGTASLGLYTAAYVAEALRSGVFSQLHFVNYLQYEDVQAHRWRWQGRLGRGIRQNRSSRQYRRWKLSQDH